MKNVLISALLTASFVLTGCAYSKQKVSLQPTVTAAAGMQAHNAAVVVKVVDERDAKTLGKRAGGYGMGAEIVTEDNIVDVVSAKVMSALKGYGFDVVNERDAVPVLTVQVRLLNYDTSTGLVTGGIHIRATLKAVARSGGVTYEKIYRSEEEHRVVIVPTAGTNAEWINAGLSDVIGQLVNDKALLEFLAKR